MKLLPRPWAVIVLVLQALVLVNRQQDERHLGPGIHNTRRSPSGVFQGLHLLFGQFDHGFLFSCIVRPRQAADHPGQSRTWSLRMDAGEWRARSINGTIPGCGD
jgi:hypothetical protein